MNAVSFFTAKSNGQSLKRTIKAAAAAEAAAAAAAAAIWGIKSEISHVIRSGEKVEEQS